MNKLKSTLRWSESSVSIGGRIIGFSALLFVAGMCAFVSAQTGPVPVIRLITSSEDPSAHAKSRVVALSATHPTETNVATSTSSVSLDEAVETERRAFEVTNTVRLRNGLTALVWDNELSRMARAHSESMARQRFFSHETPEGLSLRERARAAGILRFRVLAENIAYNQNFDDPGAFAVERWLTSSKHRDNILNREFQASAVGSFVDSNGRVYLTQVFILR